MSDLIFYFGDNGVRTDIGKNGEPLFCASDVAKVLGYSNTKDAIARHCKGVVKRDTLTKGGKQLMNFITEPDVYRLVAHSRLPGAEAFENWIYSEVIPAIRETGGYGVRARPQNYAESLRELADEIERNEQLRIERDLFERQNERLEPLSRVGDAIVGDDDLFLTPWQFAKKVRIHGLTIGPRMIYIYLQYHHIVYVASEKVKRKDEYVYYPCEPYSDWFDMCKSKITKKIPRLHINSYGAKKLIEFMYRDPDFWKWSREKRRPSAMERANHLPDKYMSLERECRKFDREEGL